MLLCHPQRKAPPVPKVKLGRRDQNFIFTAISSNVFGHLIAIKPRKTLVWTRPIGPLQNTHVHVQAAIAGLEGLAETKN
jgi:hypothetical protein